MSKSLSDKKRKKIIGICVPTVRCKEIKHFLKKWIPFWSGSVIEERGYYIKLFIHEDQLSKNIDFNQFKDIEIIHTCYNDVKKELNSKAWIIPRKTGASRSFPMYLAWKTGSDYIITLDDDCFPIINEGFSFIDTHLSAFNMDRWFRTIDGIEPRGIPYGDKGHLPVILNHGLWKGIPDLDGPTSLLQNRINLSPSLRNYREIIPNGLWFSLCAMNVCYHRQIIPAAYNLLMGIEEYGFDRFDDIWSGLLIKCIADHLGLYITTGKPLVYHSKVSNPYDNLRKEALGIQLHEKFWKHIASVSFSNENNIIECYYRLIYWINKMPEKNTSLPIPKNYFNKLSKAMNYWIELFE